MKTRTTQKNTKKRYKNIISISYCKAQNMLAHIEPVAYTSGAYGWGADIYEINSDTAIITGYRPFGKKANFYAVKKYDGKAKEIKARHYDKPDGADWGEWLEQIDEQLKSNLNDFIKEIL